MTDNGGSEAESQTETLFPLVWLIARGVRLGRLADPRDWLTATRFPPDVQRLTETLEGYLGRDNPFVDLSGWVLDELPQREAHFIDSDTDAVWAFFLLLSLSATVSDVPRIHIGSNTYGRRETLTAVLNEMSTRAAQIDSELRLGDSFASVLVVIRERVEQAVTEYEEADRERVRRAPLSAQKVSAFEAALLRHWESGFPRQLLEAVGSVVREPRPRLGRRLGISTLVPKDLLIDVNDYVEDAEFLGRQIASSFSRGEEQAVRQGLRGVKAYKRGATFAARFEAAVRSMKNRGHPPTHVLFPLRWEIELELTRVGFQYEYGGKRSGMSRPGLMAVGWREEPEQGVLLVRLPEAIQVRQYLADEGSYLSVRVDMLDESRARELVESGRVNLKGIPDEPIQHLQQRARVEVFEHLSLRVARRFVRRVATDVRPGTTETPSI